MTVPMGETLDGARYIEVLGPDEEFRRYAVWMGGHTVNVYERLPACESDNVEPCRAFEVGDFETGEVTVEDVKEGIDSWCKVGNPDGQGDEEGVDG
jgi:hypothetical protein